MILARKDRAIAGIAYEKKQIKDGYLRKCNLAEILYLDSNVFQRKSRGLVSVNNFS